MIYIFLIYLIFLACYEHWATPAVNWQVAYFAVQYAFVAAIAIAQIKHGKEVLIFFGIALIMTILSINELTWINSSLESYARNWDTPPVYTISALVIILYMSYKISKVWSGLKRIGELSYF